MKPSIAIGLGAAVVALCAAGLGLAYASPLAAYPPPEGPAAASPLALAVLAAARRTVGIRERAPNSGPEIDAWLQRVGAAPGDPWCAAWFSAMAAEGAASIGANLPFSSARAKAWKEWAERKPGRFVPASDYRTQRARLAQGIVPVFDRGGPRGHIGIADRVLSERTWLDVEGNAGPGGVAVAEVERSIDDPQFLGAVLL